MQRCWKDSGKGCDENCEAYFEGSGGLLNCIAYLLKGLEYMALSYWKECVCGEGENGGPQ